MYDRLVMTFNAGSSSLKFSLAPAGHRSVPMATATLDRLGSSECRLTYRTSGAVTHVPAPVGMSHAEAASWLLQRLDEDQLPMVVAIAHRFVHGGRRFRGPAIVDEAVRRDLDALIPLAPQHMPPALHILDAAARRLPGALPVACFDTAFHRSMPLIARLLPIPLRYFHQGIERYGFHGLSYAHLVAELGRRGEHRLVAGRVVLAHLGNGCSLAAVEDGRSIMTTMGLTPSGGVPMGTRSGDLDPGVLSHIVALDQLAPAALDRLVNRESGLLGLSETASDIRDLLSAEVMDDRAANALAVFCARIREQIASLAASLGGLDGVVFTGGIGEHASEIRRRICAGLEFMGIELEEQRNVAHDTVISADLSRVKVLVLPADEEAEMREEIALLLSERSARPRGVRNDPPR